MEMINVTRKSLELTLCMLALASCLSAYAQTRTTTYYHTDALGSIIAASDEQGDVIWEKSYDPYGKEVISTENGDAFEGQAYTGKPYDDNTGLVYLGQRYYDPELRRFMGIDSVGFRVSNPASFNRYTYANNNPYRFIDPDGRQAKTQAEMWEELGMANPNHLAPKAAEVAENISKGVDVVDSMTDPTDPLTYLGGAGALVKGAKGLRAADRAFDATESVFPNQLAGNLADELAMASSVGAKALRFGDEGFETAVNSGTIKFVVTESGELLISPHTVKGVEISHAVLSNGRAVRAAGQADIAGSGGKFIGIGITNHSGHFLPSAESLKAAREVFRQHGVNFPN